MFRRLWADDDGFVVSVEMVMVCAVGVVGLIPGVVYLRNKLNAGYYGVADAVSAAVPDSALVRQQIAPVPPPTLATASQDGGRATAVNNVTVYVNNTVPARAGYWDPPAP